MLYVVESVSPTGERLPSMFFDNIDNAINYLTSNNLDGFSEISTLC